MGLCGCTVTRFRGGNIDAATSFFVGLPMAIAFAAINNDTSQAVRIVAFVTQVWMVIYLVFGPFQHFAMGMPGPRNIFDGECKPVHGTRMWALTSGTMGVVAYYMGSYATIHFIVACRKIALPATGFNPIINPIGNGTNGTMRM